MVLNFDIFIITDGDPCPQRKQLTHDGGMMENCTARQTFDYFSGSEIVFVLSVALLLIIPPSCKFLPALFQILLVSLSLVHVPGLIIPLFLQGSPDG